MAEATSRAGGVLGVHYRSTANNIVWDGLGSHNFAPFLDANPAADAGAKYKAIASGEGGLYAFASADGLYWKLIVEEPVITEGAFDSQNLAFWDAERARYVDFHRGFREGVRDIMTATSEDSVHWTEPDCARRQLLLPFSDN